MASALGTKHLVVKSDEDEVPEGAEETGEYYLWGSKRKKVFRERYTITKKVPRIDPLTQGPMWKRGPGGAPLNTYHTDTQIVDEGWREFIQVALGNGTTQKQYDFRESPEELARRERAARKQQILDDLVERALDAGGVDELIAQSLDNATGPDVAA
jgi:hypothetical protein